MRWAPSSFERLWEFESDMGLALIAFLAAFLSLTGLGAYDAGIAVGYPSYAPYDKLVAFVNATGSTIVVQGPIVVASVIFLM